MATKSFTPRVEIESVEPYREVMIERTLNSGVIEREGKRYNASPQTFFAGVNGQLFVGRDVEAVRAHIDKAYPGSGVVPKENAQPGAAA